MIDAGDLASRKIHGMRKLDELQCLSYFHKKKFLDHPSWVVNPFMHFTQNYNIKFILSILRKGVPHSFNVTNHDYAGKTFM